MQKKASDLIALTLLAGIITAAPVFADGKAKGHSAKAPHGQHLAIGRNADCPPGLAKKNPPCVPPGLARKARGTLHDHLDIGEVIDRRDWELIRNARDLGLLDGTYARYGDYVYRVNRDTGKILAVIGLMDALMN